MNFVPLDVGPRVTRARKSCTAQTHQRARNHARVCGALAIFGPGPGYESPRSISCLIYPNSLGAPPLRRVFFCRPAAEKDARTEGRRVGLEQVRARFGLRLGFALGESRVDVEAGDE